MLALVAGPLTFYLRACPPLEQAQIVDGAADGEAALEEEAQDEFLLLDDVVAEVC